MTLKETVEKLKGEVTEVSVSVSRKLSDGAYGSFEVAAALTMKLSPGEDFDDSVDALDAYLTAKVGQSAQSKAKKVEGTKPEPAPEPDPPPIEGVEDEVEWITPISFYVHRGEGKQPVAFFKDDKKFEKKGVICFASTFKDGGLDLYGIEPGKDYDPADYNIGKVALQEIKGTLQVVRFGALL